MVDFSSWSAFTGLSQEECLGDGWLNAVHPDDREYLARTWWSGTQQGTPINAEYRLRSPDGNWRWTNVRGVPLRDASGAIRKWVGMNIDITKRKRAEEALRESEERFRQLIESSPEMIAVQAGSKFLYINTTGIRLLGAKSADDIIGQDVRQFMTEYGRGNLSSRLKHIGTEETLTVSFDQTFRPPGFIGRRR